MRALQTPAGYDLLKSVTAEDLAPMRRIDELHLPRIGIEAIYGRPDTGRRHVKDPALPYLLSDLAIWANRKALTWLLTNTLEGHLCVEAVQEARPLYGTSPTFNTDQYSQVTSVEFADVLKKPSILNSMDGRGYLRDIFFVEPLWRTIKSEEIYLYPYGNVPQAQRGIDRCQNVHNAERPCRSLGGVPPDARDVADQQFSVAA